jgi:surfeit locus 1 family protein
MTDLSSDPKTRSGKTFRAAALILYIIAVFLTGSLLALGTWQVERLSWKLDLIARVEARAHAQPVAAPLPAEWPALQDADYEYRRVSLSGEFLNDREMQVYTATDLGPGYWVMTPLTSDDGSVIIVNRGFVPTAKRDPATRPDSQISGRTAVTGLMRVPETGGLFLRKNDPVNKRWYSRDVAEMAIAAGLNNVAPFYVDADATANPGGLPLGGMTKLTFPNNHLSYAITWYILAAMVVAATWYVRRNLNPPAA